LKEAAATAELNASAADALVGAFADAGLSHAVLSPGSRNTPLTLALHAQSQAGRLRLHVVLDERSAGFFALGLARATGRAPLLLATSGSAGAHWYPAAVEAFEAELPLLLVTADRPPELSGCGAPQTVDQARFFGAFALASIDLGAPALDATPRALATAAARALALAEGARPGPVHLNAPFREPLWSPDVPEGGDRRSGLEILRGAPALSEADVSRLAREVSGARGIIVAGPEGRSAPAASSAIARLGAALGWPVLADPASGLRYGDHDRGAVILHYDALLRSPALRKRLRPERALVFGAGPCSKALSRWLGELGQTGTPISLVAQSPRIRDPEHAASSLVVAEPAALCEALAARARPSPDARWLRGWRDADAAAQAALAPHLRAPLWEGALARAVVDALPDGALLHVGNGMPVRDLDAFGGPSERRIRVVAQRGASGIDGHLSSASGEAEAWRDGPVVAVLGDLAFLHDIGGLRLVAEAEGALVVVLVDNGGGGIFEFLDIAAHPWAFEPLFLTPQRADFEALARGFGVEYRRVESAAALFEAVQAGCAGSGAVVLHAPVDRKLNVERHRRAFEAAAGAAERIEFSAASNKEN
jgi:2-succinyl-5-enolpyruvyl-6-hydroxy-3-cyclohexene-1-carboxylate synthase